MGIRENIADHLKEYKAKRGLSDHKLADELDVSKETIRNCLKKQGNPTLRTLECMAAQMGIPAEAFFLPPDHLRTRQEDAKAHLLELKRILEGIV